MVDVLVANPASMCACLLAKALRDPEYPDFTQYLLSGEGTLFKHSSTSSTHTDDPGVLVFPSGHSTHESLPTSLWYVPAGHSLQVYPILYTPTVGSVEGSNFTFGGTRQSLLGAT